MKTTKNVINLNVLKTTLRRFEREGKPICYIIFSTYGLENHKTKYIFSKENPEIFNLTKSGTGDVYGFYLKNDIPTTSYFVITGKNKDTQIKAPKDLYRAFCDLGSPNFLPELRQLDVSGLNVSKSDYFGECFKGVGSSHEKNGVPINPKTEGVIIVGLDKWNTKNAQNMRYMFYEYNNAARTVTLNLSNFDVHNVRTFQGMFKDCGKHSKEVHITGLSTWDVSNTDIFSLMFANFGKSADYSLDLSSWKSEYYVTESAGEPYGFKQGVALKIKSPKWQIKSANATD